jgi:hypothetical protein
MRRFLPSLLVLIGCAGPALGKLEIRNLQASHGPYGPARESWDIYPHDELFIRFTVTGARADIDGKSDGILTIQLKSPDGKPIQDRSVPVRKELNLGGDSFVIQGTIPTTEKYPPGTYTLVLTYRDRLSSEAATVEQKVTCHATAFRILVPRFYRDGDRKVPGPVGGLVGETLHFQLK